MTQSINEPASERLADTAAAPIRSKILSVKPEWIDYNGHLNVAWYEVLFGLGLKPLLAATGLGENYRKERNKSIFVVEAHLIYQRELASGDTVVVDSHILDHDLKRIRFFQTLIHAENDYVAATRETIHLHIDMETRKTASFPDDVLERIGACFARHASLPQPKSAGRSIAIPR